MLVAADEMETHRFGEGAYTSETSALGPAFPPTVTVKRAASDSYVLEAVDDQGIVYRMIKRGDRIRRICKPPDPEECPGGEW